MGNTCDAYHVTFPQPDAVSSSRAVEQAMEEGDAFKIPPEQVYMNAHGTGTPVNDAIETLAVKRVFGRNAHKLYISSTKSMTGHMMGAGRGGGGDRFHPHPEQWDCRPNHRISGTGSGV